MSVRRRARRAETVPADVSPFLIDRPEVYVQLGRPDKARPIIDDYLGKRPNDEGGSLTGVSALLLHRLDSHETPDGRSPRIELGTGFGHFHHTAHNIAATYAALHEIDEAVSWVEAAADDGFPATHIWSGIQTSTSLRECPRFVALISQLHQQRSHFKHLSEA